MKQVVTSTNLMRVPDVATKLGYSEQYIRRLVYLKRIPFKKLSKKALRFDPEEIEQWIVERNQANQEKPASQTMSDCDHMERHR